MDRPPGTVLLEDARHDTAFGTQVVNLTDVDTRDVHQAMEREHGQVLAQLEKWVNATQPLMAWDADSLDNGSGLRARRSGTLFDRDRYVSPIAYFDQLRLAQYAVEHDDIVSAIAESTEALAFSGMDFFAQDADDQDVYNQIAARINLDARVREMWRDMFTFSQCYVAVWWSNQEYKIRGYTTQGITRRKTVQAVTPEGMTLLDPMKIVPVGNTLFRKEQLAYIASPVENREFDNILSARNDQTDEIVQRFIIKKYTPDREEQKELSALGVTNTRDLWLLNPQNVFRHCVTRPDYQRVAPVRMASTFELLDMKHQLRQMERAHLIGGTNFIVVVTKGTDDHPAQQDEVDNLKLMVRTISRTPVMVGDHRLHVDIVTPKLDSTLQGERWNTLDSRLSARLYHMFMLGSSVGTRSDDSVKLVKIIARGMESRRHMIVRSLEKHIFRPMYENNVFDTPAKLQFHPRSIALDFDAAYATFLFDLRQNNEISRETMLAQFDLDQTLECWLREREQLHMDSVFQTQVAFSAPATGPALTNNPGNAGSLPIRTRDNGGGRRNGGGRARPGSGQGQVPTREPNHRPTASAQPDVPQIHVTVNLNGSDPGAAIEALRDAFAQIVPSTEGDEDADT